jgi:hypothetical protein
MATPTVEITSAGVYDIQADLYHRDPVPGGSLSSSGARDLLPPSCPARYRYDRDHPEERETKPAWDEGHAAHKLVLGTGPELVLVDRPRWDTNEVKAQIKEIRASGGVPLKREPYERVHAMAEVIRKHPVASALFNPARGHAEQSLFWRDPHTGVWLRARLDWYPHFTTYRGGQPVTGQGYPGRLIIPDYKTCHSAAPEKLAKAVYDFGYHQQGAWYIDAVKATCPAGQHPDFEPAFVFVCQEKTPPYLVTVIEPDAMAVRIARHLNRQAIDLYAECVASGRWPGYSDDVELVGLPGWVENRYLQEMP